MAKTINEIIDGLTLMDDEFFTVVLQGYPDTGLHIIQIIMDDHPLSFTGTPVVQFVLKNLARRSLQLDYFTQAVKADVDLEMQKQSQRASPRRLRFHSSLLDARTGRKNTNFEDLNDTYVIFITQDDIMRAGKPVCHVERVIRETGQLFQDGSHLIYVNGSYEGNDAIGRLVHDLKASNPDDMYDEQLKEAVTFFKKTRKGRGQMSELIQKYFKEELEAAKAEAAAKAAAEAAAKAAAESSEKTRKENAVTMLRDGKFTLNDIARYSGLSIDKVKELKRSFMN